MISRGKWMAYKLGPVQHLVLPGYDWPYMACKQKSGYKFDFVVIEENPEDFTTANHLPKCKRCLRTYEAAHWMDSHNKEYIT
jgi:hypothetical protein